MKTFLIGLALGVFVAGISVYGQGPSIKKKAPQVRVESQVKIASAGPFDLNEILIAESLESWSKRDFELFKKLKIQVYKKSLLSQFSENEIEDFVLSRLSFHENVLFELSYEPVLLTEVQKKSLSGEYTDEEIQKELNRIGQALVMIELKESQLKQKVRFKTWFDLLKRKYQLKYKVKAHDLLGV